MKNTLRGVELSTKENHYALCFLNDINMKVRRVKWFEIVMKKLM